jgi:hypothetical protein
MSTNSIRTSINVCPKISHKRGHNPPFLSIRRSKISEYTEVHFTPHIRHSFPIKQDNMINVFK